MGKILVKIKILLALLVLISITSVAYISNAYDVEILKSVHNEGIENVLKNSKSKSISQDTKRLLKIINLIRNPSSSNLGDADKIIKSSPWIKDVFKTQLANIIGPKRSNQEILSWFKKYKPTSPQEKILYRNALIKEGKSGDKKSKYMASIAAFWRSNVLSEEMEDYVQKQLINGFSITTIEKKINFLFWNGGNLEQIKKLIEKLPKKKRAIYKNRLKAINSEKALLKLAPTSTDGFVLYLYAKNLLKNDKNNDALRILSSIHKRDVNSTAVWKLKNIAIRDALRDKKYKKALELTENNGNIKNADIVEANWLAGFISLRFAKQPKKAINHFSKMLKNSNFSHSKSQASYWLGRSFAAIGDKEKSQYWFKYTAQNFPFFFYGQISMLELPEGINKNLYTAQPHPKINNKKSQINAKQLTTTAKIMFLSGFKGEAILILKYLASNHLVSAKEAKEAIHDYNKSDLHPLSVLFSKHLSNYGYPLILASYPTHLGKAINNNNHGKSLYFAIIRQESGFDQSVVSPAGAVGLMQLMPETAHLYAKKLGLGKRTYITSAGANISKGVSYLNDLMKRYKKSRVLAIASYNAGEEAVDRWVENYGDPRKKKYFYQILDWIHLIPYMETRFYIKKVLENMINYELIVFQQKLTKTKILGFF